MIFRDSKIHPQDTPPGLPRSYLPVCPEDILRIDLETIYIVISLVMLHIETMLEIPRDSIGSPIDNSEYLITIC